MARCNLFGSPNSGITVNISSSVVLREFHNLYSDFSFHRCCTFFWSSCIQKTVLIGYILSTCDCHDVLAHKLHPNFIRFWQRYKLGSFSAITIFTLTGDKKLSSLQSVPRLVNDVHFYRWNFFLIHGLKFHS